MGNQISNQRYQIHQTTNTETKTASTHKTNNSPFSRCFVGIKNCAFKLIRNAFNSVRHFFSTKSKTDETTSEVIRESLKKSRPTKERLKETTPVIGKDIETSHQKFKVSETPPISEINPKKAIELINEMSEDLKTWVIPKNSTGLTELGNAWNDRIERSKNIMGYMKFAIESCPSEIYNIKIFQYNIDDKAVGIMMMDNNHIDYIVTHIGSNSMGGALIEQAVKYSCELGYDGRVNLYALKTGIDSYRALGFIHGDEKGSSEMTLDPNKSDLWKKDSNGEWRLAKYIDKGYVVSALKPNDSTAEPHSTPACSTSHI